MPSLASTFYDIANQEMHRVNSLHDQVASIIRKHREKEGEPPAPMMAVYEYLHSRHIDKAAEVRRYLEMYQKRASKWMPSFDKLVVIMVVIGENFSIF